MPSISERLHIRWGNELPTEPTSTLVVTSKTSHFVDIRLFKPRAKDESKLPNTGGPEERLEWAFAGVSRGSIIKDTPKLVMHSTWDHWVDSKVLPGEETAVDEGDIYPDPDTDVSLEYGSMKNPETGVVTKYEEAWRDLPCYALGSDGIKYAVVMKLDDTANQIRGLIVRVAQYCQGFMKVKGESTIERWQYLPRKALPSSNASVSSTITDPFQEDLDSKPEAIPPFEDGEWTRLARLGNQFLPCAVTFQAAEVKSGGTVTYGTFKWVVEEKTAWRELPPDQTTSEDRQAQNTNSS